MTPTALAAHGFRHTFGEVVAALTRQIGMHHIERIEDAVQTALMRAVEVWPTTGVPDQPSAWIHRVAHNRLMDDFRQQATHRRLLDAGGRDLDGASSSSSSSSSAAAAAPMLAGQLQDDVLRLLFVCCDDAIPLESQLVVALKTLCGFDVREIALRLFTSEANVYKRLGRARARWQARPMDLDVDDTAPQADRLPAVHQVLYVLFTEGHLSSDVDCAIRRELCDEAIRLTTILADHAIGQTPTTRALLALMHLHATRLAARHNGAGDMVLLAEQDRSLWDQDHLQAGLHWLAQSATGDHLSRFHVEAGIAAEHCLAPSFHETRWDVIADGWAMLERVAPSPLHRLNRAVAVAEGQGPQVALALLADTQPPTWLAGSHLWTAVLADLHRRAGHVEEAARYRTMALSAAPSSSVRTLLERRLGTAP